MCKKHVNVAKSSTSFKPELEEVITKTNPLGEKVTIRINDTTLIYKVGNRKHSVWVLDDVEEAQCLAQILAAHDKGSTLRISLEDDHFVYEDAEQREIFLKMAKEIEEEMTYLGSGHARNVYDAGDYVYKIASSVIGVWANRSEVETDLDGNMVASAKLVTEDGFIIKMEKVKTYDPMDEEEGWLNAWHKFEDKFNTGCFDVEYSSDDITDGGQIGLTADGRYVLFDYPKYNCPSCNRRMSGCYKGTVCDRCLSNSDKT